MYIHAQYAALKMFSTRETSACADVPVTVLVNLIEALSAFENCFIFNYHIFCRKSLSTIN